MTQIYAHPDATVVGLYQSIVAAAGIPCFVRDEESVDPLATLPMPSHVPSLCVNLDEDAERAVAVIREYQRGLVEEGAEHEPDWVCTVCGASVPASFGACWKCGAPKPAAE